MPHKQALDLGLLLIIYQLNSSKVSLVVAKFYFQILLRCLPLEREEWCTILLRTRNSYDRLKSEVSIMCV